MSKQSLVTMARSELAAARGAASGRSTHAIRGGPEHSLKHILVALTAGNGLDDHKAPGDATLQVLVGRVRLSAGEQTCEGTTDDLMDIPPVVHSLHAIDDSVVLLTISVTRS